MMNKKAQLGEYVTSIVLVILFASFALLFAMNFIINTNPSSEILDAKYKLNQSAIALNSQISSFSSVSEDVRNQLGSSQPSALDYVFLIFRGAFYIPVTFLGFVFSGITTLTSVLFIFLTGKGGIEPLNIIVGVISSIVVVTIVLLIVQAIRTGATKR